MSIILFDYNIVIIEVVGISQSCSLGAVTIMLQLLNQLNVLCASYFAASYSNWLCLLSVLFKQCTTPTNIQLLSD